MVPPTRARKRWSGRLRTAGALLILAGAVAGVDRLLPGAERGLMTLPIFAQVTIAAGLVVVGLALFLVGKRWK